MGNLIWHEYAHFVAVTSSVYTVWSAFWALYYRKFFWDFAGGIVRDPGGIQPTPGQAVFVTLIVKNPIIQIFAMLLGLILLAIEFPIKPVRGTAINRSFALKIVLLLFQTFLTILYYQGTNAAIYSFIAALCFIRAQTLGETMKDAKANRGKDGGA